MGNVPLSAPISRDSAHAFRCALLLLYIRFIRLAPQKDLHICQALLFQGAVSELPQLLSYNLVALVVGVYPIWVNLSLLQVYLNIGHVFIGGRRGNIVIDLLYVRLQAPNVFYFPLARPGSNGIVNKDLGVWPIPIVRMMIWLEERRLKSSAIMASQFSLRVSTAARRQS